MRRRGKQGRHLWRVARVDIVRGRAVPRCLGLVSAPNYGAALGIAWCKWPNERQEGLVQDGFALERIR